MKVNTRIHSLIIVTQKYCPEYFQITIIKEDCTHVYLHESIVLIVTGKHSR